MSDYTDNGIFPKQIYKNYKSIFHFLFYDYRICLFNTTFNMIGDCQFYSWREQEYPEKNPDQL